MTFCRLESVAIRRRRSRDTRSVPSAPHVPPTESTSSQPENPDIETETRPRTLPLDDTLLELSREGEAFFESETDTQDMEESRKHIIGVQEDAYKVSCSTHVDPSPGKIHTEQ